MEEVDQSSEGTLSIEVRSSEGAVRQGSSDLPHKRRHKGEGHRGAEEGNAATVRVQKDSKDKDAPKRPAGGVFGQR